MSITGKTTMSKKTVAMILAIVMVLSLFVPMGSAFAADYKGGEYYGTGVGYGKGQIQVKVTVNEEGAISAIEETAVEDANNLWTADKSKALYDYIIENQTTDFNPKEEVSAISGATISAKGALAAVKDALSQAVDSGIFASGEGTMKNPYVIENASQLAAFATSVDDGESYEGQYVVLGNNIDLADVESWNPIGTEDGSASFNGTFDGKGCTISNLTIDANVESGDSYHGLFATLGTDTVVKNLNLADVNIAVINGAGKVRIGGIAGSTTKVATAGHSNIGTRIDNCSVTGNISAISTKDQMAYAGGIAGSSEIGTAITNCWVDANVTATAKPVSNKNSMAGGIIGNSGNYALIANCASFGDITAESPSSTNFGGLAGGIVGMMAGKQYNCYATGDATVGNGGTQHTWVGVLDGEITSSGMPKDSNGTYTSYPEQGAFRIGNYFATDATLTVNVYKNKGAELDKTTEVTPVVDRGFSSTITSVDKAMVSEGMTKAEMVGDDFAATLNGNIKTINKTLDAYGITGVALREWQVEDGKVLPTGEVWIPGEIENDIFASGDGSEESPYIIETEKQLRDFAASMNDKIDYSGKYVELGNDIVVSGDWSPIGGSDYLFDGTFDGKNHKVTMTLGSKDEVFALDKDNHYIGLFGILGPHSVVKNVNVDVEFYASYEVTAYLGGIAGAMQGSMTSGDYTGAVIDSCSASGTLSLTSKKGNQFVGGLVGMQYKGAIINSSAKVKASGVVLAGDLAEVGGLVGLNNRGLVANCYSDSDVYGSGSRENGNEGMAVVSNLVACNAGALVNCYGSGDVTTKEHSTYAGMVSGWVTGIGKTYTCWYDLDSTMIVGKDTDNPLNVKPVESIGTKVASGVNDEGDAYTGGLVDKMTGYDAAGYAAIAKSLNETFVAFPIDITVFGLDNNALKNWTYEGGVVTFGDSNGNVHYVKPDCEKVVKPELAYKDGVWYGRDAAKKSVVEIKVEDGKIIKTTAISGEASGDAYDEALAKAQYKAIYGDYSHYKAADPSNFAGGSGTEADPYLIANEAQLRYLSDSINADVDWNGKYFKQTADITLTDGDWQPIGWALDGEVNGKKTAICAYPFRGNYDGDNYTISGLTIGSEGAPADQKASGLFGLTAGTLSSNELPTADDQTVTLKNIHLEDIDINVATRYETFTGGLVGSGQNGIYIDNCSVTGKINVTTSESFARGGGLAASVLRGAVTNSWADVDVNAVTDTNHVYAGGLYGMDNRVTTVNCYALGDVTGNSSNNNKVHIGGLVGQAGGIHVNCYAAPEKVISLKTTTDVGVLNGRSGGITIDVNCYYNKDAALKQGDTIVSPAKAIGVNANNQAVVSNVVGKTAAELQSAEFAAELNANRLTTKMKAAQAVIDEGLEAQAGRNFVQQYYYLGNDLSVWKVLDNGIVGFAEPIDGAADASALLKELNGSYTQLWNGAGFNAEYNSLWHDYCAAVVGESAADYWVGYLKNSMSGENIGQAAVAQAKADPAWFQFNCDFQGGVKYFTFDGSHFSGVDKDGNTVFSSDYEFIGYRESGDQPGADFYVYKAIDENVTNGFEYFAFRPDSPARTAHIEFRYGSNLDDLLNFYSGQYAYWMGAGIPVDEKGNVDPVMMEKAVALFCLENLKPFYTADRSEDSLSQLTDLIGEWDADMSDFRGIKDMENAEIRIILGKDGIGKTYVDMRGNGSYAKNKEYHFFAYDNDSSATTKSGIYVAYNESPADGDEALSYCKYAITEENGKKVLTLKDLDGNKIIRYTERYVDNGYGGGGVSYDMRYTLSFNTDGGSAIGSITRSEGTSVSLISYEPKKDGYIFAGWYSDKALMQKVTSITLNSDKTVYAKWNKADEAVSDALLVLTIDQKTALKAGQAVQMDVAPIIVDGRTYIPTRIVAETLGASVNWDAAAQSVTITSADTTIVLTIGSDVAYVNGKAVKMDAKSFIAMSRTYTPARFVAEQLGATVVWNENTRQVLIMK